MKILISRALSALAAPAAAQDFRPPQGRYMSAGMGWRWVQSAADVVSANDPRRHVSPAV